MQTIQVVLDEGLLRAADEAARKLELNRSALLREALRQFLNRIRIEEKERLDRLGFERQPDTADDLGVWESLAAWPGE